MEERMGAHFFVIHQQINPSLGMTISLLMTVYKVFIRYEDIFLNRNMF